jgi:formylglycine-generating enzyme required for sulfatase activity
MEATMKLLQVLVLNLIVASFGFSALAEQRFALLIGNQNYAPGVGALTNPHKDIELVGSSLQQLGFNVVSRKDLRRADIMREVSEFIARLSRGGDGAVGFFYYSGHGVSRPTDRFNYLIPVDVTDMQDLNIWWNTIPLETLLNELRTGAPNASHIVVFDACRNELRLPEKTAVKGFEPMGERSGLFIAFSTSPNTAASDRGIDGGHYAQALASELKQPGQDQMHLFQNVKRRVFTATGNTQRPWESNGLLEPLYLAGVPDGQNISPNVPNRPSISDMAKRVWEFVKNSKDVKVLSDFVDQYPDTDQGALARNRIAQLERPDPLIGVKPGQSFRDQLADGQPCPTCPEMVVIPAGSVMMGSPEKEVGRSDEEGPEHRVTIAKPLAIGKFSITRGEFAAFVKETGHKTDEGCDIGPQWKHQPDSSWRSPGFNQDDRHPVVCVNWHDAKEYTTWLSKKVGKVYRLLTEAEREYAARAKTTTRYSFGDDDAAVSEYAWYKPNSGSATHPVGQKKPNAFGLFDMHGNVWAWCEDSWHPNYRGAPNDGSAWRTGGTPSRVLRGGSWFRPADGLRSAYRVKFSPEARYNDVGFRVARGL